MTDKVLIAVDGSPFSIRAVHIGANLLNRNTPGVIVLLTIAKPRAGMEWFQGPISDLNQAAEEERRAIKSAFQGGQELLREAYGICRSILKDQPVQVETVVATGDPAQQIMENAKKKACDLIILGSRGMGPLRGVILGSVSRKVLNNTQRPVLIVK